MGGEESKGGRVGGGWEGREKGVGGEESKGGRVGGG